MRTSSASVLLLVALLGSLKLSAQMTAKLQPESAAAFDKAAKAFDQHFEAEARAGQPFLLKETREDLLGRVHEGDVVIEKIDDNRLKVKKALSHAWVGAMFDPKGNIDDHLKLLVDYDRHQDIYAEVAKSRMVSHDGDRYESHLRIVKKKVLTAVLNADFETEVIRIGKDRVFLRTIATRIAEVANAGKPDERERPVGEDSGFLWRQNSYWLLRQAPDGLYLELASISLSRSIPISVAWMVKPFITSIPKDTIEQTLIATRIAARK